MSIFLIRYVSKAKGNRPGALQRAYMSIFLIRYDMSYYLKEEDQDLQRGCMSIFLIRYVLKAWASRPGVPKRIYEYIPH